MALPEDRSEHSVTRDARTIAPLAFPILMAVPRQKLDSDALRTAPDISSSVTTPCVRQRTGIGTEFLAPREKVEMTRLDSTSEPSLVPVGRAHRAYTRAFCAHPRRMPQT
jgi:hypothetical protein